MKSKVTFEELKATKPQFHNYLVSVALETVNAAYGAVHFIGKAWLAAREEEKSDLAVHAFYLFDDLLCKQNLAIIQA